jgi:hypothetical protein
LTDFLLRAPDAHALKKFVLQNADQQRCAALQSAG